MITGAWPPSSMMAGFICAPAMADRCLPTGTEPVNVTRRTDGCGIRYCEMSDGLPNTRFSTPGGKPASANASTSCTAPAGVSSDAFRMIEQPADRAPPTLRAGELIGKFHSEKAATTPTGWRNTECRARFAGDDTAVDTTALLRIPFDDLAAAQDFQA